MPVITGKKRYVQHNRALVPPARRQRERYRKMVGWIAGARMYFGVPSTKGEVLDMMAKRRRDTKRRLQDEPVACPYLPLARDNLI
jgi:hypothetical protein